MLQVGSTLAGRYEIIAPLGAGGMGEVYRAKDLRLDRLVAIKILRERLSDNPGALKRFEREAKALAALTHPNIVDIHDIGSDSGITFAVMELLEGETLRVLISRSLLPWKEAVRIGSAIANGLSAAHSKGVVHRDLKPENIFLTPEGQTKILDFGLAQLRPILAPEDLTEAPTQSKLTESGVVLGTLPYMSPEQLSGASADTRTDIFSLGCILYEMISGKRPFSGKTHAETAASILKDEPSRLTAKGPPQLEAIIQQCLKKNPEQRFDSAHDLMLALEAVMGGGEVKKRPAHFLQSPYLFIPAILLLAVLIFLLPGRHRSSLTNAPPRTIDSLAVLPLENLSGDPKQEYFSDGMTEELITDLAQIKALRVISRTSVMRYKGTKKSLPEIAKELKVDAVVEGSVLREGNRVRITAQLIHAPTDTNVWAQSYERELQNVLALQSEIARTIVNEIRIEVSPQEKTRLARIRTVNPEAHENYLKGRFYLEKFSPDNLPKAIEYLQSAIDRDPGYAPAYAALSEAYARLTYLSGSSPQEGFPKAKAAAAKALQFDESLAEAHAALGYILTVYDWDWSGAQTELQKAIELNPNSTNAHVHYGLLLGYLGRLQEAIWQTQRAMELDPLSLLAKRRAAVVFIQARRYDQAIAESKKILEMDPNYLFGHYDLGVSLLFKKNYQEALPELQKAFDLFGRELGGAISPIGDLGETYARLGNRNAALKILDQMNTEAKRKFVSPYGFAKVYRGLGENEKAIEWLEEGYRIHDPGMPTLKVSARWDQLRADPRFQDLLRRMNFP